ncbi:MAG: sugar transporter permease [Chloroflexi bacterium]|nr:sugar transporter permease [Chloroflexota bacterium]
MISQSQRNPSATAPFTRLKVRPASLAIHLFLIIGALTMVGPFIWMILTSFKSFTEATHVPPVFLPAVPEWSNYSEVFSSLPFFNFYVNTIVMALGRVVGVLFFCSMMAYALARIEFPGRNLIFLLVLSVFMVPGQVLLIPQYLLMSQLGWLNSLQALIAPGLFSAFGTFQLRQYFLSLPKELEEAARLDGANHFQIYWRIMLPLVKSGLLALAILKILWSWNELLWPLIVNNSPDKLTLSAGLAFLQDEFTTNYPQMMAGATLAILPMIVMFAVLQRYFIEGIAISGSKGG